jgi:hypothetical protein
LGRLLETPIKTFDEKIADDKKDYLRILYSKLLEPFAGNFNNTMSNDENDSSNNNASDSNNQNQIQQQQQLRPVDKTDMLDKIIYNRDNKNLWYLLDKTIRYRNHSTIFKIHKSNGTTPDSLYFHNFARPFFPQDEEFVDRYNKIIETFQKSTIDLIVGTLEKKNESIQNEIAKLKPQFNNVCESLNLEFSEIVEHGEKMAESNHDPELIAKKFRANRCEYHKYEAIKQRPRNNSRHFNNFSINSVASSLSETNSVASYNNNRSQPPGILRYYRPPSRNNNRRIPYNLNSSNNILNYSRGEPNNVDNQSHNFHNNRNNSNQPSDFRNNSNQPSDFRNNSNNQPNFNNSNNNNPRYRSKSRNRVDFNRNTNHNNNHNSNRNSNRNNFGHRHGNFNNGYDNNNRYNHNYSNNNIVNNVNQSYDRHHLNHDPYINNRR